MSSRKATEHGLEFRPPAETIADTLAWHATRPADHELRAGMKADREKMLLEAWKERER